MIRVDPNNVEGVAHEEAMDPAMFVARQLKLPGLLCLQLRIESCETGRLCGAQEIVPVSPQSWGFIASELSHRHGAQISQPNEKLLHITMTASLWMEFGIVERNVLEGKP
jgi:hypothetical protein